MGVFVPGFKHDVFISYAHANNRPKEEGWVTKFHEALEQLLEVELGRREYFSIWRDNDELRGNDDFEAKIDMAFLNSAVLISIYSQSYVESKWCLRELIEFSRNEHSQLGLKVGEQYRVFRIELGPIKELREQVPDFFGQTLGYKFYETKDGIDKPFRRTKLDVDDDQRYWDAMRRLVRDIAQLLRQMKSMTQPAKPQPACGPIIYLAETTEDLDDQRSLVKSALVQKGVKVIPEFPLSLGDAGLSNEIRSALRSANLSVHLVGEWSGKKPVGEERPIVQLQWDLATEIAKEKNLPRLVWHPGNLDLGRVKKEQHLLFLRALEGERSDDAPAEVLRVGIEELREILLQRIFPPAATPEPTDEEENDCLVYLTYLPTDRDEAVKVKELLRRERLDVTLFRYEDRDPRLLERIHQAGLEKSDGIVIFYGQDALWAYDRALEARDIAKMRKKKNPIKAVCLCDGPPEIKDSPGEIEFEKFIVTNCRDGVTQEDLKTFVGSLKI